MKKINLSAEERAAERDLLDGVYRPVSKKTEKRIVQALADKRRQLEQRRKDAILHIRINGADLARLKEKAGKAGVPYQTFISEVLHHVAQ
jgi:predicted DNA binding CopG/RHH family protein